MKIPSFLDRDNYLQNPIMRRFLKEHNLELVSTRADYINSIERFSEISEENKAIVCKWLLKIVKEGSKEICYRKIHGIGERHRDVSVVEAMIKEAFPECPRQNVLAYRNSEEWKMIDYHFYMDEGEIQKIEFTFSQLYLCGEEGKNGETTVFPIFIEVYLNEGFVISRAKAKSTLYPYDANNPMLLGISRINTMAVAVAAIDQIINIFSELLVHQSRSLKLWTGQIEMA